MEGKGQPPLQLMPCSGGEEVKKEGGKGGHLDHKRRRKQGGKKKKRRRRRRDERGGPLERDCPVKALTTQTGRTVPERRRCGGKEGG